MAQDKRIIDLIELTEVTEADYTIVTDTSDLGYAKKVKTVNSSPKIGVYSVLSATDDTTCTTADTYYTIEGTLTNSPMNNFEFDTDKLKYKGVATLYFEVDYHASVTMSTGAALINMGIKKTGVLEDSSVITSDVDTTNSIISGTCVIELDTDDTIQMVVSSDTDADVITFDNLMVKIRPFYR